jgi:hypothetical protein
MWLPLAALASGGLTLQRREGRSLQDASTVVLSIKITKRAKDDFSNKSQAGFSSYGFFVGFSLPWMHQFVNEGET